MITLSDSEHALPLYRQLYRALQREIQSGQLSPGSRLPSKRSLADSLCISVNTVDAAYAQLEAEGFVEACPRRGYFVLDTGSIPLLSESADGRLEASEGAGNPGTERSATPQEVPDVLVDFSPSGMARKQFPFSTWKKLMRTCLNDYDEALLLRTPPQGDPGLRQQVADYLYRARNVHCTPEQIIIGAGTDNLLLILAYILDSSYTLAFENPLYNQAHRLFARLGHPIRPVAVDRSGPDLSQLPSDDHCVIYTTPSHQYPLGFAMPIGRRAALLNWSAEHPDRYIIEDDYDSEFRYETRPIPSLQSIDTAGRVIYLGTFSRSIAPALRISYMVLPEPLLSRYRHKYRGYSSTVSGFEQTVLREFIASGSFETHVNRMRVYYRARRSCLLSALDALSPQPEILGVPAGHHITMTMKNGMQESELVASALKSGVKVYPISPYFLGDVPAEYHSTVLLGYGGLEDHQIRHGISRLVSAWNR